MKQEKDELLNIVENLQEVLGQLDWDNAAQVGLLMRLMDTIETQLHGDLYGHVESEKTQEPLLALQQIVRETRWEAMEFERREEARRLCVRIVSMVLGALREKKRKVVVFLPYKASMWDSLESIWRAADADPSCETHVVPIPYYERNPDFSLGAMHYEGGEYPSDVPVEDYRTISLEALHPQAIYIHNPYDRANIVTTIDPAYYSDRLKAYTELLIYVPYYATTGGQADGQSYCPVYEHADYIVVQAECMKGFFDARVPREKILALGSPKFDKVVRLCQEPPDPPAEWKEKMAGKRVYFYNTSLGGMLLDTISFLRKMQYVFDTFADRADACLLWRPHPLMESTFSSMRPAQLAEYERLKQEFISRDIGILDTTPSIETAIAWSDAYVGDSGTSVTSLFGVAGKPAFILDNQIHALPSGRDWMGKALFDFPYQGDAEWLVTWNNKLFHSPQKNYQYEYYCDLSDYAGDFYYRRVFSIGNRVYVCPANARDILVLENRKIVGRVSLEREFHAAGAFMGAWHVGRYIFLIPIRYPAIVRYDTETGGVHYWSGPMDQLHRDFGGMWFSGGNCIWQNWLVMASPNTGAVFLIDVETLETERRILPAMEEGGCISITVDGDDLWLLPANGQTILRWRPRTNEVRSYQGFPEGFRCVHVPMRAVTDEIPFWRAAVTKKAIYLPAGWGNMNLVIDKDTREIRHWETPFSEYARTSNGYFFTGVNGLFLQEQNDTAPIFVDMPQRKLYRIDFAQNVCEEIPWRICETDQKRIPCGFCEISEWLRYGCEEDAFNTLADFLDGNVTGAPFDRTRQLRAFDEIAANSDGTAGEKIHAFVCKELQRRGNL